MAEESTTQTTKTTTTESLQERYENVSEAINKILAGGQSYKIGSRQLTRADLSTLIAERDRLESAIASKKSQDNPGLFEDTFVAYFEGR